MAKANPNDPPCDGRAQTQALLGSSSLDAFEVKGAPTATDITNGTNLIYSRWGGHGSGPPGGPSQGGSFGFAFAIHPNSV